MFVPSHPFKEYDVTAVSSVRSSSHVVPRLKQEHCLGATSRAYQANTSHGSSAHEASVPSGSHGFRWGTKSHPWPKSQSPPPATAGDSAERATGVEPPQAEQKHPHQAWLQRTSTHVAAEQLTGEILVELL